MIKLISFIYRNPALTPEQFRDYWVNTHAPLVRSKLPRLRGYAAQFPLRDAPNQIGTDADGVVELIFDSVDDMQAQMGSPDFNTPDREASSLKLLDLPRTHNIVVEIVNLLED
jgi:uncharacterized protein (TIGR02118 family)